MDGRRKTKRRIKSRRKQKRIENKKGGTSQVLSVDDVFKLADLYFKQKYILYSHLHNSYDKFIVDVIRLMKEGHNIFYEKITKDTIYRYKFEYSNIRILPPKLDTEDEIMFPSDARIRSLTYAAKLIATVTQIQETVDVNTGQSNKRVIGEPEYKFPIANLPVMIRSRYCSLNIKKDDTKHKYECELDPGGYFIVRGSEKVVMSLERMADNKPLVFTKKDSSSLIYTVQVNSKSYGLGDMTQIITVRMKKGVDMTLRVPIINEVPVFVVFRALGVESDKDIINMIVYDDNDIDMINHVRIALENSIPEDRKSKIMTQESAYEYLINKMRVPRKYSDTDKEAQILEKKMHLESLLTNNFIPHIEADPIKKAYYLGYMINRLLQVYLGRIPKDDRDSYANKRIDLPGDLLFELFKQYYKKMLNECSKFFRKRNSDDKNPLNIINQIKPSIIELGLNAALLTGAWGKRKGVAQMLHRLTYLQTMSSLRRINSPTVDASTNKLTSPRHLHATQLGFVCCVTGDTDILLSNGTTKKIRNFNGNETVITVNKDTLLEVESSIYNLFSKMADKILKISSNGYSIKCDPEHPLMVSCNDKTYIWKHAGDLTINDYIVIRKDQDNKVSIKIDKIEELEPELVYDFTTEHPNHSFIANSFVTHNCVETPEGHKVGLVKNMSMIGNVTIMLKNQVFIIKGYLQDKLIDLHDISAGDLKNYTRVFLNGEWLGLTKNPRKLFTELKQMKYNGDIDAHTSIIHELKSELESKELKIYCDGGRLFRPTIRVENNELLLKKKHIDMISLDSVSSATKISNWNEFMIRNPGIIEYLDVDENMNSMIAMYERDIVNMKDMSKNSIKLLETMLKQNKLTDNNTVINRYNDMVYVNYTHCEIHPSLLLGIVANNIPFCNHNQGPRNMFQYSQARQAMGFYISNYRDRMDISYILYHSQRPLITTRTMRYIGTDKLPSGENVIVAIACYTGYIFIVLCN
jgi:DNA-directed RNA polymerase beta subunit